MPPVSTTWAAKFAISFASVVDTGGKFAAGVVDAGDKLPTVSLTPVANLPQVSLTPVANLPPVSMTPVANNWKTIRLLRPLSELKNVSRSYLYFPKVSKQNN